MKLKLNVKEHTQLPINLVEEKTYDYLNRNAYRIIEKGSGFIIFIDDKYSDRKRPRSDYHTRIGEGKFIFHTNNQGTDIKLIYLTPILYPVFLMTLFAATGAYFRHLIPILMSLAFLLPILLKTFYMNNRVFDEILEN